jgi:hypothetical protein
METKLWEAVEAWRRGVAPKNVDVGLTAVNVAVRDLEELVRTAGGRKGVVVVLEGGAGDGKTHLLRLVVSRAAELGKKGVYVSWDAKRSGWQIRELLEKVVIALGGDLRQLIELTEPEDWWRLARTAKERFHSDFSPKERHFIFDVGRRLRWGDRLSEAQARWAGQVLLHAALCGAVPEITERFAEWVVGLGGEGAVVAMDDVGIVDEGEGGWSRSVESVRRLAVCCATGRWPFRLVVAAREPDGRKVVEEAIGAGATRKVQIPALEWREAQELARVVLDVWKAVNGKDFGVRGADVKEWVERGRTRRGFVQRVVREADRRCG